MEAAENVRTAISEETYSCERLQTVRAQIEQSIREHAAYDALKRVLDVVLSLFALLVLMPMYLFLAIYVFFCDPHGSPVYRSIRCGKNGTPFTFLKFRTMYMNADQRLIDVLPINEMDGPVFKAHNDPRIILKLRILRETSLDELLQFIHVLTGQMSIVGPRPPLPREVARYGDYEMLRMAIKPGLTCYWQVLPRRNDCSFDEWLEQDIRYIMERNLLLDLKLMFKTFCVMMHREGI